MEQGLAHQMVYGSGSGQNTGHYYAGAPRTTTKKHKKKCDKCKKCRNKK